MKRALMYASVASMIQQFNMENIRILLELGYEVDVACNMEHGSTITGDLVADMKAELESMGVQVFHVPVPRNITAVSQILKSYKATKKLIKERNYDVIHCHSPIGGMVCRTANRFSGRYGHAKMIYTAHGFHFFQGAPRKNWLMFYPIERLCSRYTDVLITINHEDYELATRKMKAKHVKYVPGVGVDLTRFAPGDAASGSHLEQEKIVLLSVGELSSRKNHQVVFHALSRLNHQNIKYYICGTGSLKDELLQLASSLALDECVELLGYRSDVAQLYRQTDLFVFPSKQEGLPVALMEAIACEVPVICSDIRGNNDLIHNKAHLFDPTSPDGLHALLHNILDNSSKEQIHNDFAEETRSNRELLENFSIQNVSSCMRQIYES